MPEQFDEAAYNEGRADFDNGVSLLDVIKRCMAAEASNDPAADAKSVSAALGFASAFIDKVRSL